MKTVSIRRKQMLLLILTSGVPLLLACLAFLAYERFSFRQSLTQKLESLAMIVGNASTAALEFRDPKVAQEVLAALRVEENITAAVIYDRDGRLFAHYVRMPRDTAFAPPPPLADSHEFSTTHVSLYRRVTSKGERLGTVYLESNLRELSQRLQQYVKIVAIVLVTSACLAWLLSTRMRRVIIDPILALAGTARKVSEEKNYALRVQVRSQDELGQLMTIFNQMLEHIQARDAALQAAHDQLETRVRQRTSELQQEIIDRSRAEQGLQQQLSRISLLNSITRAIASRQDLEGVVRILLRQLEQHLPIDFGEVLLYDRQTRTLTPAKHGTTHYRRRSGGAGSGGASSASPEAVALATSGLEPCADGRPVIVNSSNAQGMLKAKLETLNLRSLVAVPLMVEGELFAILLTARGGAACSSRRGDEAQISSTLGGATDFSASECEFLRMLSDHVALAAYQARLYAQLQRAYDELRQTQAAVMQQERLRALGQMASGIAHDINNALCPIVVYADLLLANEKEISDTGHKNLQHIKTSGEDIAHIVSRMREFYRPRDDRDSHLPTNLNRIANQVIELTRPRWRDIPQARGIMIQLRTEFQDNLPEILASQSELREAITNLLLNAVDAMPQGGQLLLRTTTGERVSGWAGGQVSRPSHTPASLPACLPAHPGRRASEPLAVTLVTLEIIDTGIGMDEQTAKRCLEPFFSTKGKRGTGLGLPMVYGIMQRHQGDIQIHTQPSRGTTIRLHFPVLQSQPSYTPASPPACLPAPRSRRVLCIDDEPIVRELLDQLLHNAGHTVELADGGQAGLDQFRAAAARGAPFHLVITDLGMPYIDGRQLATTIKAESPDTPIIMLTGWGTIIKQDGDLPTHVDAVLSKPPKTDELLHTLARLTDLAHPPSAIDQAA